MLAVSGRVKTTEVMAQAARLFGPMPAGTVPAAAQGHGLGDLGGGPLPGPRQPAGFHRQLDQQADQSQRIA